MTAWHRRSAHWVIFDRPSRYCLPDHVRFAPKATEMLRRREMTRRVKNGRHVVASTLAFSGVTTEAAIGVSPWPVATAF